MASLEDNILSANEVRHALDEVNHQIQHLNRSQVELLKFLEESEDEDIRAAYEENKHVLVKKRGRAKKFYELLETIDPAYFVENATSLKLLKDQLQLEMLTPDEIEASTLRLRDLDGESSLPIEIVRNGLRQTGEELRILHGRESGSEEQLERPLRDGIYL